MRKYLAPFLMFTALVSGAMAAEIGNTSVFSQTDGSNNSGTVPTWAEGQAPSQVNDSARALQGAVTREWNWRSFTLTAGGTADAKTLTYGVAPAAYYTGQIFSFIANTTNTATATINVNGLGAKTIKKDVSGTMTALDASDMVSGMRVMLAYDGTDMIWINKAGGTATAGDSATAFFTAGTIELARGGTGASLADPNADRLFFWDDSAGAVDFLTLGTAYATSTTTLRSPTESLCIAASDETTAITTGTAKVTFHMPYAFTLTSVTASLNTVSSSGLPAFDLNEDPDAEGATASASVFSTTLTIDATERRSSTALTSAVISDTSLAANSEMKIDIDTAGTGAKGVKICLIGYQT